METDTRIAIIGGGISGLSMAYTLVVEGKHDPDAITVFEATQVLGGNADTAEVILGTDFREGAEKASEGNPFIRLADLGVNDVNITAYKRLAAAMKEIGYFNLETRQPDNLRPLEDSACFFTPDGGEIFTMDKALMDTGGVVDMRFSLQSDANRALKEAEDEFMAKAATDFDPDNPNREVWGMTSAEYVAYYIDHYCDSDEQKELIRQVARIFLYPRIAAMYFADEMGPQGMPFRGIMSYYRLQEGYGVTEPPLRMYFKRGSQDWINHLADWLRARGVSIWCDFKAEVAGDTRRGSKVVLVTNDNVERSVPIEFDKVVMACHADHQLAAFQHQPEMLLNEDVAEILGQVRHAPSRAVAHTFTGVLPPNRETWRTYNVMVREGQGLKPYTMTYVQNRHRNDRMNPEFDKYGLPIYFVTLNPDVRIPDAHVLRMPKKEQKARAAAPGGYGHLVPEAARQDDDMAVAWFRHVVQDLTLLNNQDILPNHQGIADGRVYFVGCWTLGAGLHEECFHQAENVLKAMTGEG